MKTKPQAFRKQDQLVRKLVSKWNERQRLCREWLDAKARGEGSSSCCNIEAHRQAIRTLDQCKRELREIANTVRTCGEPASGEE